MRVGVLCGGSPRSMYVANTLCAGLDVACILCEVGREYSWRKLRRSLRPAIIRAKLYRRIQPRLFPPDVDQGRFLFPDGRPRFANPQVVHRIAHINAPRVVDLLERHSVDFVAVFGTSLIRNPALLDLAPNRIFNLHGGLSPWYRGSDSTFWALYNGEIDRIGCTIHRINRRIDAGELIAHVRPAIEPGEREHRLFCKAIMATAEVYAQAIRRAIAGELLGTSQPPGGRLYLHRQRRHRHDRELQRRYATGGFPDVRLPLRVTWYTPANSLAPAEPSQPRPVHSSVLQSATRQ